MFKNIKNCLKNVIFFKSITYEIIPEKEKEKQREKFFEMLENSTESITLCFNDLDFNN